MWAIANGVQYHEIEPWRPDFATSLACATQAQSQPATSPPDNAPFDVDQLIASTCGFCHSDGGRAAGKGPQLMNSPRDDDFIRNRIKNGKVGTMAAFGSAFSDFADRPDS
jgi:mono/diheme cytochrome c family protein